MPKIFSDAAALQGLWNVLYMQGKMQTFCHDNPHHLWPDLPDDSSYFGRLCCICIILMKPTFLQGARPVRCRGSLAVTSPQRRQGRPLRRCVKDGVFQQRVILCAHTWNKLSQRRWKHFSCPANHNSVEATPQQRGLSLAKWMANGLQVCANPINNSGSIAPVALMLDRCHSERLWVISYADAKSEWRCAALCGSILKGTRWEAVSARCGRNMNVIPFLARCSFACLSTSWLVICNSNCWNREHRINEQR